MNLRIGSGVLLSILLLGGCAVLESNVPVGATSLAVEAKEVDLDPEYPQRTRFGDLTLLGSFVLSSAAVQFGGLSGLAVDPSGRVLYAVSDRGYGLSARLRHDAQARLIGLHTWAMMPLRTPQGTVTQRRQRDAEALVREPDGAWLVAFEQVHRVWRYPPSAVAFATVPEAVAMPAELGQAPVNGGLEAMTRLADGRLLVLTESFENAQGDYKGWIVTPTGFDAITYVPQDEFCPTDLATLPGGDVVLLERRYSPALGVAVRLRRIAGASIRPQARLRGRELLHLKPPLAVDNFEGLAVRAASDSGALLYLISDNNFNFVQRTLLLQFRLGDR
ncbi:MAG: esterase-like activity of phytase family protein [Candidatus Tectomicrobia bacterium]|nr:esterase-like activity of phytase family protein [Candidatus Tectomicrobia bacterium]